MLELAPTVDDRSLRSVLHGRHATPTSADYAADRLGINRALEAALRDGAPCAASTRSITAMSDSMAVIGRPVAGEALAEIQSTDPADDYLRIRVTDYGQTPRRWRAAYVSFEVVSTAAIAAGLYVHRLTRPLAGAYLLEESIEEVSEGYAGFWALNRLSRPVRIEADLINGQTGAVLWHEAHTGLAPWSWSHLRHMDDATRQELLDTSIHKAVKALVKGCARHRGQGTLGASKLW